MPAVLSIFNYATGCAVIFDIQAMKAGASRFTAWPPSQQSLESTLSPNDVVIAARFPTMVWAVLVSRLPVRMNE